ncbi:MAG: phosphonate ABC transporter, permease protein PhnE, partial [Solobacterium sp.]|nr:phosphonate ABC transporter, permease protein PhnE [Solobacterium sp.]
MANKTQDLQYDGSLFDKIIKPEVITLENGHTVVRPRSRLPFILLILIIAILIAARSTGFDFKILINRIGQLGVILGKIFNPNWSFFPKVLSPLLGTIKMSIVGTVVGCVVALPLSIFASSNINKNRPSLL